MGRKPLRSAAFSYRTVCGGRTHLLGREAYMEWSRREFVAAGLVAAAAGLVGCKNQGQRPGASWPGGTTPGTAPSKLAAIPQPRTPLNVPQQPAPMPQVIEAIPRSRWATAAPVMSRIYAMDGVN